MSKKTTDVLISYTWTAEHKGFGINIVGTCSAIDAEQAETLVKECIRDQMIAAITRAGGNPETDMPPVNESYDITVSEVLNQCITSVRLGRIPAQPTRVHDIPTLNPLAREPAVAMGTVTTMNDQPGMREFNKADCAQFPDLVRGSPEQVAKQPRICRFSHDGWSFVVTESWLGTRVLMTPQSPTNMVQMEMGTEKHIADHVLAGWPYKIDEVVLVLAKFGLSRIV